MTSNEWWILLLLVPMICAVIGWLTNVVAIKMIFRPREPVRVLGLHLQGVLPKHRHMFARELADVITSDFLTTAEMVDHLDLQSLYQQMIPRIDEELTYLVEKLRPLLGEGQQAMFTDEAVSSLREELHKQIETKLPMARQVLKRHAEESLDLTDFLAEKIESLGAYKVEELIYRVSRTELRFIEYYGGVFGFAIGLLQLIIIRFLPIQYSLPLIGIAVGVITNYLAIQMLFYPRDPRRIGPIVWQGLFPKRQQEIARAQAEIAAEELIRVDEIFHELRDRLVPAQLDQRMIDQAERTVSELYPSVVETAKTFLTVKQQKQFRQVVLDRCETMAPQLLDEAVQTTARHIDIRQIFEQKISTLPRLKFEQLLRGLFEREEFYLLIYGGLFGGVMGLIQLGLTAIVD